MIPSKCCATLIATETNQNAKLTAEIQDNSATLETSDVLVVHDKLPEYAGSYEITPLAYEAQTLETKDKTMTENLTVLEIPLFEVSNEYGTTVNIGG